MPFRAYPDSVATLLAGYLDKAIARLKLTKGGPLGADDSDARNNIIDGMLSEYDLGERREERIISAGLRRHNAFNWNVPDLNWNVPDQRSSKKRDESDGDAFSDRDGTTLPHRLAFKLRKTEHPATAQL